MYFMPMNEQKKSYDDELNIREYWGVLVKRAKLIGIMVAAVFFISAAVSLILPKIYSSTTSILPPQQESAFGAALSSQLPSGLSGLAGGLIGGKTPADLWVGILRSRTVKDAIIARFNLMEAFNVKTIDDARKGLDEVVFVSKGKEDIISITVEDGDPDKAARMANAFVEELDRVNKMLVMSSGKRIRVFVEERLKEAQTELTRAEEAVREFQEKNRAIKLDEQSKAIIEAIGTVKGQLIAKEVELSTLLSYATPHNPQAEILKTYIKGLKEKLKELEEGVPGRDEALLKDIFIPTSRIPDLNVQFARLLRDAKIQETLYEMLTQQYEMARIQEARDSATVQVLDAAKAPEKRTRPKRTKIVAASTAAAFFFSVLLAFFMEYLERTGPGSGKGGIL